ncbi:hypothetical protein ACQE3E_00140 [Methylomonas sp. MED-D]|uniref:hypothetical protein n=1 Tax=unclassified Methylomonas TaxID=2608980 RepID=UPI0028A415CF|nr:hypothetical protein [Methylomonas sp. MV1]MDT4330687.1 hypothetical protein [Methylomonas sp. MV1]
MSRPFLGRSAIVDIIEDEERTNAVQKRKGLMNHPVRFTVCGYPDPNRGGWHNINADRTVPSSGECEALLKADNVASKSKKPNKGKGPTSSYTLIFWYLINTIHRKVENL